MALTLSAAIGCTAIDGDTLRCGAERVRLLGIDAPELHRCPRTRKCVAGDGQASKRHLARLILGKRLTIERHGKDRYGRTLAYVWAGRLNLSCAQIAAGQAAYIAKWNTGDRKC